MVQTSTYSKVILFTCTIGIGLSAYAYIVKEKKTQDAKYQSLCDINEHMSCSRVLTSEYAKGFGFIRHVLGEDSPLNVSNTIYGGAFFVLFALLSLVPRSWSARIQVGLSIVANLFSIYLGSILYFVLKDFCLLCVSTYAVNFFNLILSYLRLRSFTPKQAGKQKDKQKSQKGQKKQQQNEKQKSPQAEKKKSEKQKSPQAEKQKQNQNQQNGKVKNQQNEKQKSPKTPNSKKKN